MPTYLVTYHGAGGPPPSAEAREQMMAAFGAWVGSVGDHMVDPGDSRATHLLGLAASRQGPHRCYCGGCQT